MASSRNDGPLAGTASSAGEEVSMLSIAICLFRTTLFSPLVAQSMGQCQHCRVGGLLTCDQIGPTIARRRRNRGADRHQRQMRAHGTNELGDSRCGTRGMCE